MRTFSSAKSFGRQQHSLVKIGLYAPLQLLRYDIAFSR